ncbi:transcription repressor OFP6-like [Silene latifolia]|uniref:transcription repressor OFP6-like n=1 Tax=Silene latifolia TaxID=37657 RepID=UPI003D785C0C
MSSSKKKLFLNTVSVNLGCNCRRPKLSSVFTPKPKSSKPPKYQKHHNLSYSSSTNSSATTTTTWDKIGNSSSYSPLSHPSSVDGFGRVGPRSVAVEKESNDPYVDFRQSMLQMIVENEIYSKGELKELLNCFLQLNPPSLHGVIIRVFTEIWNGFFFSGKCNYSSPGFYVRPKSYET